MKHPRLALFAFLLAVVATTWSRAQEAEERGWQPLFDGQTLTGWEQKNGTATYRVEQDTIVGQTAEGSPNSFLSTQKEYGDFELELEVKVDSRLNSGIQIRSKTKSPSSAERDNNQVGRVYGPQVEIETGGTAGYVYGEATDRGWLTPDERRKPHEHFKDGEWNKFRIVARGPRIQTWINGVPIEDLTDEQIFRTHPQGFISLQVHGIGRESGPYEVAWRNIRIREL
jgi:hypothetical protein